MSNNVQIKLMALADPDCSPSDLNEAVNFVAETIERVMGQDHSGMVSFDHSTGEPFMPLVFDTTIVDKIGTIGVVSPYAMASIFQKHYIEREECGIFIAPIIIDTLWV